MGVTNTIAQRCSALFLESKRSLTEIAEALGVTYTAVLSWKNGRQRPTISSLESIAEEFKVPMEYFFTSDDRAEFLLYGTPLKEENAEINKLREDLKAAWGAADEYRAEMEAAKEKAEKLQTQIDRMTVELEHYRNQPAAGSDLTDEARRSIEVSRCILDAAISILDGVQHV